MSNKIFLDIHVIQTLPPSNVNRDDSGSPKTAMYGGARRARVSSQAWKAAMRRYFEDNSPENVGVRTKRVIDYVAEQIEAIDSSIDHDKAMNMARSVIEGAGISIDKKKNLAKAMTFIGKKQAMSLAHAAIEGVTDKKKLQECLKDNPEIDIVLFGRMVANDRLLSQDASAQVAHAISTHAVETEFDYYTAMDEYEARAGMIDTAEYNSETLYRYANIAVHELIDQLGSLDSAIEAVKLFVEAFSNSMPSGKINSFANDTLPQAIMVNIRRDRPVSLVSAYEKPVRSTDGYVKESVRRLFNELDKSEKFVDKPAFTFYLSQEDIDAPSGKEESNLKELLNDLSQIKQLV